MANPYPPGQCTWYVASLFAIPSGAGFDNADTWASAAQRQGWTDTYPHIGDVMVLQPGTQGAGSAGHVAVVTNVAGGKVSVNQMDVPFGSSSVSSGIYTPNTPGTSFFTVPRALWDTNALQLFGGAAQPGGVNAAQLDAASGGLDLNPLDSVQNSITAGITTFVTIAEIGGGALMMLLGIWFVVGRPGSGLLKGGAELGLTIVGAKSLATAAGRGSVTAGVKHKAATIRTEERDNERESRQSASHERAMDVAQERRFLAEERTRTAGKHAAAAKHRAVTAKQRVALQKFYSKEFRR